MSVLSHLHRRLSIGASEPASSPEDVDRLMAFANRLEHPIPTDYVDLIRQRSTIEFVVDARGCFRIWSAADVVELNEAYRIQAYLPGGVALGDDEGGEGLVAMEGERGYGVYRISFSDIDPGEAVFLAQSLSKLLVDGIGLNELFGWM